MGFRSERCTDRGDSTLRGEPSRSAIRRRRPLRPGWRGVWILLLACLAGGGAAASAQSAGIFEWGGRDRLLAELERTDRVLERAADHAADCSSPKAKVLLREARELQARARELYGAGGPTLPVDRIVILTRQARELAVDAIELCQVESKAQESLRSMLDSTSGLLDQAESTVAQSGSADARRLLDAAVWQLDRARAAYRTGETRRAILLGGVARGLVLRALDRARGGSGAVGPRLEVALDRTEALLSEVRAADGWNEDPRARALLERAEREQDQARDLQSDGAAVAALQRTRAARESALDALWMLQRSPQPERIRDARELVARLADQAEAEIDSSGSAESRALLREVRVQLRAAEVAIAGRDWEQASAAVRTADSLLRRAVEKVAR